MAPNVVEELKTNKKPKVNNSHITALDGIRGLAVSLVLASHFSANNWQPLPFINLTGIGKSGVFLFFILSSFLLSLQFLRFDHQKITNKHFWLRYCERRILRIWPLYIFILIFSFLTVFALNSTLGIDNGWPYTIHLHDLWMHLTLREGFSVLWSIPVEFKYYLILPFIAILNSLILKNNTILTTITTVILILVTTKTWPSELSETNSIELKYYLSIFFIGQYAAVIHSNLTTALGASHKYEWLFETTGFICLLIIFASTPSLYNIIFNENISTNHFHKEFIFHGTIWGVFILCVLHGKGYMAKIFTISILRYLGLISFSLYLWHGGMIKIGLYTNMEDNSLTSWILIIASIFIASLSYKLIEKPFMSIKLFSK